MSRRLLLDSHILLWWLNASWERLSSTIRGTIDQADGVFVSVATAWELEIKSQAGRLELGRLNWQTLPAHGVQILAIEIEDGLAAARLPLLHRDPFDRMIVAQAMRRGLTLVTADGILAGYGVDLIEA